MEIMLAVSVLLASLGWGYSAIHTHIHTEGERKYKSLWEGMMEANGQLAQEKADVETELEIADDTYKMAIAQLEKTSDDIEVLTQRLTSLQAETQVIPPPSQPPTMEQMSETGDPLWIFAEENRDLMPTWELLRGDGVAAMQPHRRYGEWATFCGNLPELNRGKLEDAIEALG